MSFGGMSNLLKMDRKSISTELPPFIRTFLTSQLAILPLSQLGHFVLDQLLQSQHLQMLLKGVTS